MNRFFFFFALFIKLIYCERSAIFAEHKDTRLGHIIASLKNILEENRSILPDNIYNESNYLVSTIEKNYEYEHRIEEKEKMLSKVMGTLNIINQQVEAKRDLKILYEKYLRKCKHDNPKVAEWIKNISPNDLTAIEGAKQIFKLILGNTSKDGRNDDPTINGICDVCNESDSNSYFNHQNNTMNKDDIDHKLNAIQESLNKILDNNQLQFSKPTGGQFSGKDNPIDKEESKTEKRKRNLIPLLDKISISFSKKNLYETKDNSFHCSLNLWKHSIASLVYNLKTTIESDNSTKWEEKFKKMENMMKDFSDNYSQISENLIQRYYREMKEILSNYTISFDEQDIKSKILECQLCDPLNAQPKCSDDSSLPPSSTENIPTKAESSSTSNSKSSSETSVIEKTEKELDDTVEVLKKSGTTQYNYYSNQLKQIKEDLHNLSSNISQYSHEDFQSRISNLNNRIENIKKELLGITQYLQNENKD